MVPQFQVDLRFGNANAFDRVFAAEPDDVIVAAKPCRNQTYYLGQGFGAVAELTSPTGSLT